MSKCTLCLKIFPSDSQLKRHKNNKKSCNVGKEEHKCELCNIIFPCLSKLEKHKKSNKHINIEKQYITDNSIHIENLNLNITNNITVINGSCPQRRNAAMEPARPGEAGNSPLNPCRKSRFGFF